MDVKCIFNAWKRLIFHNEQLLEGGKKGSKELLVQMPLLNLFQVKVQPDLIFMNILCSMMISSNSTQFTVDITDLYIKLIQAVPTLKADATRIPYTFHDHQARLYGITAFFLTENGTQFASKFLQAFCIFPGLKHLTTTVHNPRLAHLKGGLKGIT